MSLLDADRFSPTIFVGLGGAGGAVVNMLAGKLTRRPNFDHFRDLIHFVAVDTNKADLQSQKNVPEANRFLISSFDRRTYVERKRGKMELSEDPMVTQWVHDDYQFRGTQGAGAGQIRVESRLGLYYNLEEDRARIRSSLQRMLDAATKPENPYRDNQDRVVNICVYASVAGGTGSGGFLTFAYLFQDLVNDHGWGRPNVVGTLMLPSIFMGKVEQRLHPDINANGYAALKELEHVTKLAYKTGIGEVEFHYDPMHPERHAIRDRPFSLVYLIDKPSELALENYYKAIADASFLQIFSPILGDQAGEYDNYEKRQKSLALNHFCVHYGTLGSSVVLFPRKDILHYAALRYAARALDKYLVLGDDKNFRVRYGDPKFERLSTQEKAKIVDDNYLAFVAHQADLEKDQQEKGTYTGILEFKAPDGKPISEAFQTRLRQVFSNLDEKIEINPIEMMNIQEQSTSLARSVESLRRDISASRTGVMGEYLQSMIADLRSDRFFGDFFRTNNVPPLTQRYLLTGLKGPLLPTADDTYLLEEKQNSQDLDSPEVTERIGGLQKRLQATASQGSIKSLLSRDNKEFQSAKRAVGAFFDGLVEDNRRWLKVDFWQKFHEELRKNIEGRLNNFRSVAAVADEAARQALDDAKRFQADPASSPGYAGDSDEYYLDIEVLRDDRSGTRLWDRFFQHKLDKAANYDEERIFAAITAAFQPATDDSGRVRAKDAQEIVRDIRQKLFDLGHERFTGVLQEELKLDLRAALELEARYVATRSQADVAAAPDGVAAGAVDAHIRDKFERAINECVLLANIDESKRDDPSVTPNDIFYVALAKRYSTDESGSLKTVLKSVSSKLKFVEDWDEEDMIVFYRALIGIPVYFFRRVNDELVNHYRAVKALPNRSYPLHIEKAWEDSLPNLDPREMKQAEQRRKKEEDDTRAAEDRSGRLWSFSLSTFLGNIQRSDAGYEWVMEASRGKLGTDRAAAFEAFVNLEPALRKDLEAKVAQSSAERAASAPARRKFKEDLGSHLKAVNALYYQAVAEERDREKRFLEEEKTLLEARIGAMPSA
jgi:hypothetical protein